ncbi:MAG: hypothetical protein ACLQLH_05765 [Terracidiphilus sp.]
MKRTIPLCTGLLAFALLPALAQTPVQTPAQAPETNAVIKNINADLKVVIQDFSDAIITNDVAIKVARYLDAETILLRDTAAKPDASTLWAQLGQAQTGLATAQNDTRKYDEAITNLKKALDIEAMAKKPNGAMQASVDTNLGEIYARTGSVANANAAYAAAAKADPTRAAIFFKNGSVIFSQVGNAGAQSAAADEAIKVDPKLAIVYYLKAQGLIGKSTFDTRTQLYTLPPGCAEAYRMYLQLAPNGAYADAVKGVLAKSTQ